VQAEAPVLLMLAVPMLICASVLQLGTPLLQFPAVNQSLLMLPVQIVVARQSAATAMAGETQSANAATANKSTFFLVAPRSICEAYLFFMILVMS
jgi:hypothetical protein